MPITTKSCQNSSFSKTLGKSDKCECVDLCIQSSDKSKSTRSSEQRLKKSESMETLQPSSELSERELFWSTSRLHNHEKNPSNSQQHLSIKGKSFNLPAARIRMIFMGNLRWFCISSLFHRVKVPLSIRKIFVTNLPICRKLRTASTWSWGKRFCKIAK